jgi:phenylacetate-coenzyme A ligase PaaK-like adenylate-forming protein
VNLIDHYSKIPFLPIEFFKTHNISSVQAKPELVFQSSGTTGQVRSTYNVYSEEIYRQSILKSFIRFYGDPAKYIICALVPDYKTHHNSSLAYMLEYLTGLSSYSSSGFYLGKEKELLKIVNENPETPKIIFGITYALMNFAMHYSVPLQNTVIIETGGMKGKMKEITRAEVHKILSDSFNCSIHSEYSMAELMSQAYLADSGQFFSPPWMKIIIREVNDPLSVTTLGQTGGISIIDLANFQTCSFIATQDLGKLHEDGTFEVLGRFDFSDIRGCNLLSAEL